MIYFLGIICVAMLSGGIGIVLGGNDNGIEVLGLPYYWYCVLFGASSGIIVLMTRLKNLKFREQDYIMLAILPLMAIFAIGTPARMLEEEVIERLVSKPGFEILAYLFAVVCTLSIGFVGGKPAKPQNQ